MLESNTQGTFTENSELLNVPQTQYLRCQPLNGDSRGNLLFQHKLPYFSCTK